MRAKDRPTTSPKIRRFPRLPEGLDMTELAKSVWTRPTFKAEEVNGVTNFIFSVSLRGKIKSEKEDVYVSLFESGGPDWITVLNKAYLSARSGKPVADFIDTMLYKVFRKALQILMEDAKTLAKKYNDTSYRSFDGKEYPALLEKIVENEAIIFALTSDRTTGRKPTGQVDWARPIRLAERHATLAPLVSELKHFVDELKAKDVLQEETLRIEVRSAFKEHDWIHYVVDGCAFQEVPPNTRAMLPTPSNLAGKWAVWELIVGIIRCEENKQRRGRPISALTISRLIGRGRKLLSTASKTSRQ